MKLINSCLVANIHRSVGKTYGFFLLLSLIDSLCVIYFTFFSVRVYVILYNLLCQQHFIQSLNFWAIYDCDIKQNGAQMLLLSALSSEFLSCVEMLLAN